MDVRELRWDDDDAADDGLTFISSSSNNETIRTSDIKVAAFVDLCRKLYVSGGVCVALLIWQKAEELWKLRS